MGAQTSNAPTWQGRGAEGVHGEANARILLDRLDGVQPSGNGWRARCPACGGRSRKLSIAESGGKVLVHCFAGCKAEDVIGAVGLTWADLFPPRSWPESPEERRQARRAIQQAGWAAALATLATEATIVRLAAAQVARWQPLSEEDDARLALAVERIDKAAAVLVEAGR
jgi:hypothetical protein